MVSKQICENVSKFLPFDRFLIEFSFIFVNTILVSTVDFFFHVVLFRQVLLWSFIEI